MFKDITIGQYYPVDSILHKLDPRVKLFGTLVYIISLFIFKGPIGIVLILGFLAAVIALSKVPLKFMLKGLRGIVFLMIFAGLINLFMTNGDIIWEWKSLHITQQGLENCVLMTSRMMLLIIGSSIMTLTTTPNSLTDGLEKSLKPLAKIKVPVHDISMMMSIALRFIPILAEETDKIQKAQMARGAIFDGKNIIKKIKAMIPLLVPLFVSAFRRANDLALAMEARCYNGGEGRTKMHPLKYEKNDILAYVVLWAFLALVIAARILWTRVLA